MSSIFLLGFLSPGPGEMLAILVIALLLYGGDLPKVARSWGKTLAEFRRGMAGFQNEFNNVIYSEPEKLTYLDEGRSYDTSDEPQVEDQLEERADDTAIESEQPSTVGPATASPGVEAPAASTPPASDSNAVK